MSIVGILQEQAWSMLTLHASAIARGMVQQIEHPACGSMKLVNTPVVSHLRWERFLKVFGNLLHLEILGVRT